MPNERKVRGRILSDVGLKVLEDALQKRGFLPPYMWQAIAGLKDAPSRNTVERIVKRTGGVDGASIHTLFNALELAFDEAEHTDPFDAPDTLPERRFTSPVSTAPPIHRATPYFVERVGFLERLRATLKTGDAALTQGAALHGMGGVGKTQTALKFCERFADEFPGGVFWLRSDTEDNLIADCQVNAGVACPEALIEGQPKASALRFCAQLSRRGGFLVVFDNVDSLETIAEFRGALTSTGRILLTTRLRDLPDISMVPVDTLPNDLGAELLFLRRGRAAENEEERVEAERLSHRLGGLPLALDQAGAFLARPGITVAGYLEEYELRGRFLREKRTVAGQPQTDKERYWEHESVEVTFSLALEVLKKESPDSVTLLNLCSFLAPDDIPEFLFTDEKSTERFDLFAWESVVGAAVRLSLLERDEPRQMLAMHRVLQDVTRDVIGKENERGWAERTVEMVCSVSPEDWHVRWFESQPLYPHWDACIELIFVHSIESLATGWLLNEVSVLRYHQGRYTTVEKLYWKTLGIGIAMLGEEHPNVATSYNNLANLFHAISRYSEAEPMYRKALEIGIATLGEEHPNVATSYNNLAELLRVMGRYSDAEPMYRKALEIGIATFGEEHPDVATQYNNLANLFYSTGRYSEAEPLYRKDLDISIAMLGEEHPNVATSYNNLANLFHAISRYSEAEPMYRKGLKILLGFTDFVHPNTVLVCQNWLMCLEKMQEKRLFPYPPEEMVEIEPLLVRAQQMVQSAEKNAS